MDGPAAGLDSVELLHLELTVGDRLGQQRRGPPIQRGAHLIRRHPQEGGLLLNLRTRILGAPFCQGPDGVQFVGVRGREDADQAPREVCEELGVASIVAHVRQDREVRGSHGALQGLVDVRCGRLCFLDGVTPREPVLVLGLEPGGSGLNVGNESRRPHAGSESKRRAGVTVHHGWESKFPGAVTVHHGWEPRLLKKIAQDIGLTVDQLLGRA
jgi:hypothetical protein